MGKTKENAVEAPAAIQDTREVQDVQEGGMTSEDILAEQPGAAAHEVIGPENESELLGCQDEASNIQPLEYAVAGCTFLNLRERPGLDAPITAVLPCGVGVSDTGQVQGDWWEIVTGRLTGWVMSTYLEPVWD